MILTKDELASGLETRKYIILFFLEKSLIRILCRKISGMTKNFMTETDVPALKLTFLVAGTVRQEQIQDSDDEVLGKLKLGLRRTKRVLKIYSSGILLPW